MADMSMRSIIEALGMSHELNIGTGETKNVCPFCPGPKNPKKKKLYINFKTNQFHCWSCQEGGSYLDFWALLRGLPKPVTTEDKQKIGRDYDQFIGAPEKSAIRKKINSTPKIPQPKEFPLADIEVRNKVYSEFLNSLQLSNVHKEQLLRRGLTEETIMRGGYKSAPRAATSSYAHNLLQKGYVIEGVPGFFKEKGEWRFIYARGFFIPVKDLYGRIKSLQVRLDEPNEHLPKYLTVSSVNKDFGTKGTASPHFQYGKKGLHTVILTEGPLKADIISQYTGLSTIAILGVNGVSDLPGMLLQLKANGTKQILIAFDMDKETNENVQKAYQNMLHIIAHVGFRFSTVEWPIEYKGLDDYLSFRLKK